MDHTNVTITNYSDSKMILSEDEPPLYYHHYDPEALQNIIDTHRKIIEYQKTENTKHLFQKY